MGTISPQAKMDNQVLGYKDLAAIPKDKAILDIERPDLMIYEPHFTYSLLEHVELPRSREVKGGRVLLDGTRGKGSPSRTGWGTESLSLSLLEARCQNKKENLCTGITSQLVTECLYCRAGRDGLASGWFQVESRRGHV